jgi:hypothetical protein
MFSSSCRPHHRRELPEFEQLQFKEFEKRVPSPHPLYIMETWSLYELLAARPHIDAAASVSQETVVERWMAQGGNPINVLCDH